MNNGKPGRKVTAMAGQRFGYLIVLRRSDQVATKAMWRCVCDCGNIAVVAGCHLRNLSTSSCGCTRRSASSNRFTTHGMSLTREYKIWLGIKTRCLNPKSKNYKNYGGRGIRICDRWLESFENFYADMGPRPSYGHSIERTGNDGHYEPSNCCWATMTEQSKNKRGMPRKWHGETSGLLSFGT